MSCTVDEARDMRMTLEKNLLNEIRDFEKRSGLMVADMEVNHVYSIEGGSEAVSVEVRPVLRRA